MKVWMQSYAAFVLLVCLVICDVHHNTLAAPPPEVENKKQNQRKIKILNESGSRVEIYWINNNHIPEIRQGRFLMSLPDVMHGGSIPLDSFVGHEFEVRELPDPSTGLCRSEVCRTTSLTVAPGDDSSEEQRFTINDKLHVEL